MSKTATRLILLSLLVTAAGTLSLLAQAHEDCEPATKTLKPVIIASPPTAPAPPVDSSATTGG